jgi:putative membrane protein
MLLFLFIKGDGHMMMSMMGGWGMFFFMILKILFWGMVIYGALTLVSKAVEKKDDPALEINKERFAKGDITEEEFQEKSTLLRKN